jgi:plastocyanin
MRPFGAAARVAAAITMLVVAGCGSGPAATRPPDAVYLSANGVAFQLAVVQAPANEAFQLYFENLEAAPHNVNVADPTGTSVARGEVFTGPSGQTLQVPALAAGTYKLLCDVHPDMHAQLVAT